ncbi:hypothetical protein C8F01DRAFT_1164400, partial [Mycena amicta]
MRWYPWHVSFTRSCVAGIGLAGGCLRWSLIWLRTQRTTRTEDGMPRLRRKMGRSMRGMTSRWRSTFNLFNGFLSVRD